MKIKFKRIHPHSVVPNKGTPYSAAFDLYLPYRADDNPDGYDSYCIRRGEVTTITLGFSTEIPEGYYAAIYIRSSLGKRGIVLSNGTGIIDSDYRGEWAVMLTSLGEEFKLFSGERVAQVIFRKLEDFEFEECDDLSDTVRGVGGFGSTGS
tara:strand:- start:6617 stop:7069 length:453 start_codon:yes stop_codon:yes gene_type:complete